MPSLGKTMIIAGLVLILIGALLTFAPRIPGLDRLGRLPGDVRIERDGFRFYFPVLTSILVSVLLSAILYFFRTRR